MTKNIVWLHSHFLYWMGGTKYIFEVVKQIAALKKYRILVVVENASPQALELYQQSGIECVSLGSLTSTSALYWLGLPIFIDQVETQVKSLLRQKQFASAETIVISSMFPMNVVANRLGTRHFQLCYEPFAFFYDQDFVKSFSLAKRLFISLIKKLWSEQDKKAVQQANQVLTLNETTRSAISEVYDREAEIVGAGVDTKVFQPYVSAELKKQYQGKKIVMHSTDYSPVKGTDRVIKAMALVVKEVPSALLVISSTIDNPAAKAELEALSDQLRIRAHVEFAGFLPIKKLPEYYSLAEVLVQGSNSAKSGTTSMALPVKEAMCCETPAIRPDVGGDDVEDGVTGFLVDPQNTELLAQKIVIILSKPKLAQQMGKRARQVIASKYTWPKTAQRILAATERKSRAKVKN